MANKGIAYDELVQNALLGVVRDVLGDVARDGLPGGHHFYIAFRTDHPGVDIPDYLKERYKEEMTIVLQNQFWDLTVEPEMFQVGLSFNQKPALLSIPFSAITGFLDPSVEFGLQFQAASVTKPTPKKTSKSGAAKAAPGAKGKKTDPTSGTPDDGGDANVVTLDTFRKKK